MTLFRLCPSAACSCVHIDMLRNLAGIFSSTQLNKRYMLTMYNKAKPCPSHRLLYHHKNLPHLPNCHKEPQFSSGHYARFPGTTIISPVLTSPHRSITTQPFPCRVFCRGRSITSAPAPPAARCKIKFPVTSTRHHDPYH